MTTREPTPAHPTLRWGRRDERTLVGAAAIVAGGLLLVQMSGATLWAGLIGGILHVLGWAILPESGPRRVLAAPLSLVTMLSMLLGPPVAWGAAFPLALWLIVRRSPGVTFALTPVPALWAVLVLVVTGGQASRLVIFGSTFLVTCLTALFASRIAHREITRRGRVSRLVHKTES